MSFAIRKDMRLPFTFAALGIGYFAVTQLRKPDVFYDAHALEIWERHSRDASFALGAGLAAAAVLWWTR